MQVRLKKTQPYGTLEPGMTFIEHGTIYMVIDVLPKDCFVYRSVNLESGIIHSFTSDKQVTRIEAVVVEV